VVSTVAMPEFSIWIALACGWAFLVAVRLVASVTPLGATTSRTRAVVIGSCASARALSNGSNQELDFVGVVPFSGEDPAQMAHLPHLGRVAALPQIARDKELEIAVLSPSDQVVTGELHRVLRTCGEQGLAVQYFPSFLDVDHLRVGLAWNADRPGLSMLSSPPPTLAQFAKRAIDVAGASIGLLLLLPVFLACALAVKLTSRGPVFFKQKRVGQSGQTFGCLKFRTMRVGAQAQQELLRAASIQDGPAFKIPHDPRITPVGRLLRKFSLDELPQLLNVLLGDMSLVGPRPPIPTEVDKYTWWQRRRIAVKPGLTCVWQVYGRNRVSFKRWVEMDLWYIDNWSLWLDLKLMAHTVHVVLRGTGM
jgi:exopolysaccharide biosynthesis polyprenyl glycosylphosphotransferase